MKQIVTIGGGTGSFTTLSGLKNLPDVNLTALVSMADDGGSTGVLRDELGVLPPGDVRQCLVALSEQTEIVRELMNYRFSEGGLKGHSFGNIFLAALEKVTGDFGEGVEVASEILKIKGKVIPVTKSHAELAISLSDGTILYGENGIQDALISKYGLEKIFYKVPVKLNEHAKTALREADFIIVGPGNYYCSIIPNLIVDGFKEAIAESKAKIIFPVNLTNKIEHTDGWKITDYVKDIENYLGKPVDFVLVNTEKPTSDQIASYELEEGKGVIVSDNFDDPRAFRTTLLSTKIHKTEEDPNMKAVRGFIRHDSEKLAQAIKTIIEK